MNIADSLKAIKDIETESEVGKISLYSGISLMIFIAAGNIQFAITTTGIQFGEGTPITHIWSLIFYFICNISLAIYFYDSVKD